MASVTEFDISLARGLAREETVVVEVLNVRLVIIVDKPFCQGADQGGET